MALQSVCWRVSRRNTGCPLWVKSRHVRYKSLRPLYPRKQTSIAGIPRSAIVGAVRVYSSGRWWNSTPSISSTQGNPCGTRIRSISRDGDYRHSPDASIRAGLRSYRCRARSQRRRSQHRQAPRPAQAVEFHRSEGRNEGARYGSGRWLYHRTFSAGGWTQWRRVRAEIQPRLWNGRSRTNSIFALRSPR